MAWQFTLFEDAPLLEDYIKQRLKFSIVFPTDILTEEQRQELVSSQDEFYSKFYKIMKQSIHFPEGSIPHCNDYSLEFIDNDIERQTSSRIQDPVHKNTSYISYKKVGYADYEDLLYIGEFILLRFNSIPKEVRLPEQSLLQDLPSYALDSRKYYTRETALIDWEDFVEVIGNNIKESYKTYVLDRFEKQKLNPSQTKDLISLIEDF